MKINKIEKALIEGQLITRTKKYLSDELKKECYSRLPDDLAAVLHRFDEHLKEVG